MPDRRIGGRGGGSDPAPKKGGPLLVAAGLALTMAASGGALDSGGAALSRGSSANSTSGQVLKARKAESKKSARKGRIEQAWQRMGMRGSRKASEKGASCVAHSFGEIRRFFARTPCRSLDRVVFGLNNGRGAVAAVSVVWVTMPSRSKERRFRQLLDVHGNGDITPLGSPLLKRYGIRFTGRNYDAQPHGRATAVAEVENASGRFDRDALDAIAEVAAALPPP